LGLFFVLSPHVGKLKYAAKIQNIIHIYKDYAREGCFFVKIMKDFVFLSYFLTILRILFLDKNR